VALPLRLAADPVVVDDGLVQLCCYESSASGRHMGAGQVNVGFDDYGLAVRSIEVSWQPGRHDEEGVVADNSEDAGGTQEASDLGIEREQQWP